MLREGPVATRDHNDDGVIGLALTAAMGFAGGLVLGMLAGSVVGDVHSDRVRRAMGRLRKSSGDATDADALSGAVRDALRLDEVTRDLVIGVHCPGEGLVELTGVAPDAVARQAAGDIARGVPGADIVVNRILVNGSDLPTTPASRSTG